MRVLATLLLVGALTAVTACSAGGDDGPGGTTYYLSPTGSDSASGTASDAPWRSLAKVGALDLRPGDRVRLRGGTTYDDRDGLVLDGAGSATRPVRLDSYGGGVATVRGATGSCVSVRADRVRVSGVVAADCGYAGFEVTGDRVTLDGVGASGSQAGVVVAQGAAYATVAGSRIHDNTRMRADTPGPDDDSGAFGVLVNGDHATVRDSTLSGHDAPSADYGRDGAAVEVFGARDTTLSGNTGSGNQTFVEVGGVPGSDESAGVRLVGNRVTATRAGSFFVVVHAGDRFGSADGVRLVRNVVALTGAGSVGVFCGPRCDPAVLALVGNDVSAAQRPVGVEGTYASTGNRLGTG